jgi:hypothetical protein
VRNKVASRKRFIELYNLEIFEMILFYINLGFHNKNRDKFLHCAHNIILVNKSFAIKNLRLLFFAINLFPLCVYANNSTEKQLLSGIFHNYDELARSLLNNSEHVKVKIEFSLLAVRDLDMRNQELSSSAVISIPWTDEFLKWNTSSHGGLDLIRVPLSKVWKPDVIISNSVNRKDIFEETGENVIIYNNGTVLWHSNF